jgi:hypothetical protein
MSKPFIDVRSVVYPKMVHGVLDELHRLTADLTSKSQRWAPVELNGRISNVPRDPSRRWPFVGRRETFPDHLLQLALCKQLTIAFLSSGFQPTYPQLLNCFRRNIRFGRIALRANSPLTPPARKIIFVKANFHRVEAIHGVKLRRVVPTTFCFRVGFSVGISNF